MQRTTFGSAIDLAKDMIMKHEGLKLKPYVCTAGKLTIGYGRNLEQNGITEDEASYLLDCDIFRAMEDLRKIFKYESLPQNVRAALINMMFNLGLPRFRSFKKMIAAINEKNYVQAAVEMLDSKWALQVGQRAIDLAYLVKKG
jgi:lysozyme